MSIDDWSWNEAPPGSGRTHRPVSELPVMSEVSRSTREAVGCGNMVGVSHNAFARDIVELASSINESCAPAQSPRAPAVKLCEPSPGDAWPGSTDSPLDD